jgi:hypothetical protein
MRSISSPRALLVCLFVSGVGLPYPAHAQSAAELDKARARALAGLTSLENKAYATALAECEEALQVIQAPTVKLCRARALAGLKRWDDAAKAYDEIAKQKADPGDPPAFDEARKAAKAELGPVKQRAAEAHLERGEEALEKKNGARAREECAAAAGWVPSLRAILCRARGAKLAGQTALAVEDYETIVGTSLASDAPAEEMDAQRDAKTELKAVRDEEAAALAAAEKEKREREEREKRAADEAKRAAEEKAAADAKAAKGRAATMRVAGWITLGVGAAGLAAAGGLAGGAVATNDSLVGSCAADLRCGLSQAGAIDTLAGLRLGTFVAGGVGLASLIASGALHLAAWKTAPAARPKVEVGLLGTSGVWVGGRFWE